MYVEVARVKSTKIIETSATNDTYHNNTIIIIIITSTNDNQKSWWQRRISEEDGFRGEIKMKRDEDKI